MSSSPSRSNDPKRHDPAYPGRRIHRRHEEDRIRRPVGRVPGDIVRGDIVPSDTIRPLDDVPLHKVSDEPDVDELFRPDNFRPRWGPSRGPSYSEGL